MRNPWGRDGEWTGDWSDSSNLWNEISEDKQKEIGHAKRDDGIFFIPLEDYIKNYA